MLLTRLPGLRQNRPCRGSSLRHVALADYFPSARLLLRGFHCDADATDPPILGVRLFLAVRSPELANKIGIVPSICRKSSPLPDYYGEKTGRVLIRIAQRARMCGL